MALVSIFKRLYNFIVDPAMAYDRQHPFIFLRIKLIIYCLRFKTKRSFKKTPVADKETIDIMIPAIEKDFDVLPYVIDSAREQIKHKIDNFYIISPKSAAVTKLCKEKKCIFVDEDKVLPVTVKDIDYKVEGHNRAGWLFQQLLKLSGNTISKHKYYLVLDADTVLVRPFVFVSGGKILFDASDDHPYVPYFHMIERLLGKRIKPVRNFTSHHFFVDQDVLAEMKKEIETRSNNKPWYQTIIDKVDRKEICGMSEYETYGQYFYLKHRDRMRIEHWMNTSLPKSELKNIKKLKQKLKNTYKTISFHSYNE